MPQTKDREVEVLSPGALKQDLLLREISVTGTNLYKNFDVLDYNPDDLVGRKGLGIYAQMRLDDQIKAVMTMKKYARLMTPWEIVPASQDEKDLEIADFVSDQLEQMEGTFEDQLLDVYTALDFGFSISEKVYYRIDRGPWVGKIGLKALKTRNPLYYGFISDVYGNLLPNGIVYLGGPLSLQYPAQSSPMMSGNQLPQGVTEYMGTGRFPIDKFVIF